MPTAVLTTCDNTISAHIIRTKLESEGIPCFLKNEYFTDLMPQYFNLLGSGVQIIVNQEDLLNARQIIHIDSGKITCPECGSENIRNDISRKQNWLSALVVGLLGVPFANMLNNYHCSDCKSSFKK